MNVWMDIRRITEGTYRFSFITHLPGSVFLTNSVFVYVTCLTTTSLIHVVSVWCLARKSFWVFPQQCSVMFSFIYVYYSNIIPIQPNLPHFPSVTCKLRHKKSYMDYFRDNFMLKSSEKNVVTEQSHFPWRPSFCVARERATVLTPLSLVSLYPLLSCSFGCAFSPLTLIWIKFSSLCKSARFLLSNST